MDIAKVEAKETHKPMMIIIHKEWCSVCQTLKQDLGASKQFENLSSQFVMIDGGNENEPKDAAFQPDGNTMMSSPCSACMHVRCDCIYTYERL